MAAEWALYLDRLVRLQQPSDIVVQGGQSLVRLLWAIHQHGADVRELGGGRLLVKLSVALGGLSRQQH